MTRQEVIRKMCDAYFTAKDKGVMESKRAEAALNALLGGGKKMREGMNIFFIFTNYLRLKKIGYKYIEK